jgi:hypothetical protein
MFKNLYRTIIKISSSTTSTIFFLLDISSYLLKVNLYLVTKDVLLNNHMDFVVGDVFQLTSLFNSVVIYSNMTIIYEMRFVKNVLTTNDFLTFSFCLIYLCLICHLYQLMSIRHCFEDITISLETIYCWH